MSKSIQIKHSLAPTPTADRYELPFGVLTLSGKDGQTVSKIEYAPGQQPHQSWPLKRKYRR